MGLPYTECQIKVGYTRSNHTNLSVILFTLLEGEDMKVCRCHSVDEHCVCAVADQL